MSSSFADKGALSQKYVWTASFRCLTSWRGPGRLNIVKQISSLLLFGRSRNLLKPTPKSAGKATKVPIIRLLRLERQWYGRGLVEHLNKKLCDQFYNVSSDLV
jgi:hypothetical protein